MAIRSFSDKPTEEFFISGRLGPHAGWGRVRRIVKRKLDMPHYAAQLGDLRSPPGNRLEALKGKLSGYHSVRVNDQWRVVFRWTKAGPTRVRVTDYH
ncbi:MAG: type II toxin-antitoxin system RelE/ParE family toxin [Acidobacteriota bacterium]|nr:type II toxin-antitoxin system RelE/ParE family toxin [Acidobacteriota bacterium]